MNGHSNNVDFQTQINRDFPESGDVSIVLIDDDGDNIAFMGSKYSSDFKEITNTGFNYTDGSNYVESGENILIKR